MSSPTRSSQAWDKRYQTAEMVWSLEPNQFVSEYFDLPVGNMVDVAGGEGRNALAFAKRGWRVENVEFSAVALEKFEARAIRDGVEGLCHSTLSDAQTAKFQLEPSLVIMAYLQLPWQDLELALDNALSQLSSGSFFGVFHARRNLLEGYGGPQSIDLLPSIEQFSNWADKSSLDAKIEERLREVETPDGTKVAIDLTVLVRR